MIVPPWVDALRPEQQGPALQRVQARERRRQVNRVRYERRQQRRQR